jgi:hypothetical protein
MGHVTVFSQYIPSTHIYETTITPFGFRSEPTARHGPWPTKDQRRNQYHNNSQKDYNQVCQDQ